jgi:hypothetical protein
MRKLALVVVALGLMACNNGRSGGTDSGMITVPDTGMTGNDSGGGGRDSGGGGRDSGGGGSCSLTVTATSFGSMSAACGPRCSAATATAVAACMDGTCINNALMADTTPGIPWTITVNGMSQAATQPLDCGGCFGNQQLHCYSASGCAMEVTNYISCDPAMDPGMCMTQLTALNNCGTTNQTAIGSCLNGAEGVGLCFP